MENISVHITYKEATRSQVAIKKGIENIPSFHQLQNMKALAQRVFEPLRIWAETRLFISSFFRSLTLNFAIGGSPKSDHCAMNDTAAMDIDADVYGGITNRQVFHFIRDNLDFDQLIWEYGNDEQPDWVHVSYSRGINRKIILRAFRTETGTKYIEL